MTAYNSHYRPLLQEELKTAIPAYRDLRPLDRRTDDELEILLNHIRAVGLICSPRNKPGQSRNGWEQGGDLIRTNDRWLTLIQWFGSSRSRCFNDAFDYLRNNNVEHNITYRPAKNTNGRTHYKAGLCIGNDSPHFSNSKSYTMKCNTVTVIKKYKNGKYWGEPVYDMDETGMSEIIKEIKKEILEGLDEKVLKDKEEYDKKMDGKGQLYDYLVDMEISKILKEAYISGK